MTKRLIGNAMVVDAQQCPVMSLPGLDRVVVHPVPTWERQQQVARAFASPWRLSPG